MDLITAYAIYMTVAILIVGLWAVRVPHEDVKMVFILALAWPMTLFLIAGSLLLDAIGWGFDAVKSPKWFGFRKPTNTEVVGFALTLFRVEFQVWKARKA